MPNNLLVEEVQIVSAIIPVDLISGANAGDWVSLKGFDRCAVVVFKAAGAAGDDPILKLQQATDVSGAGAKDLLFTRVDYKRGVQTATGTFSTATQAAATSYVDALSAEAQGLFVIEVRSDELDVNNNFDCLQISIADVGPTTPQLGCALYILRPARYGVAGLQSAIVD
jgi:hypothetical protein